MAAACGSNHAKAAGTFNSPAYGYRIVLPTGWTAVAAERRLDDGAPPVTGGPVTDIFAERATRRIRQLSVPAVVVGAQRVAPGTSLADWTARVIGIVSTFKGCAQPVNREDLTVGGVPAVLLTYPNCPAGSGLYHLWVALVHDGLAYQIVWFNHPGREVEDRALLQRMLASAAFSS